MLSLLFSFAESDAQREILTTLYEENKRLMKHVAWQILQQEEMAEDAVHDAFLNTLPILEGVRDPQSPRAKALLIVSVKNVARSMQRKSIHGEAAMERLTLNVRQESASAEKALLDRLSVEEILFCLRRLEEKHREVLLLKVRQDASDSELAAALGISPTAWRKRLQRARQALIDSMKKSQ
ncbi:MAG: sigma-70 family RNA polymerase sigma factor [Clostridia bacterium]|nr:sigma-70 family RNA polymerase sigma factor [Clostridia bacterium]